MIIDNHILINSDQNYFQNIFIPPSPVVVMARSNPSTDCNHLFCSRNNIAILKRLGGGGSVVLYNGCVVISLGIWLNSYFKNDIFFTLIQNALIDFLESNYTLPNISQKGISDLVIANQKFLGSSIYRSKNYLLYQASIIVKLDIKLIENCLPHPSKEPKYRKNKSHKQFLTSLSEHCLNINTKNLKSNLSNSFKKYIYKYLNNYIICSDKKHSDYLKSKTNHNLSKYLLPDEFIQ